MWVDREGVAGKLAVAICVIAGLAGSESLAQPIPTGCNQTPGDGQGLDDYIVIYAPYFWEATAAEYEVKSHCTSQGYSSDDYIQLTNPHDNPTLCTVDTFYSIVHDSQDKLGVVYISTHGAVEGNLSYTYIFSVETFETVAARDAKLDTYYNRPNLPFARDEVVPLEVAVGPSIAVTSRFLMNYGRLTKALVFLGACHSGSDDSDVLRRMVRGDARVSIGIKDDASAATIGSRAEQLFRCLDGHGQMGSTLNRTVHEALDVVNQGAPTPVLHAFGQQATTLSAAVIGFEAPCPISVGDTVTFFLDTVCDVRIPPEIEGFGCQIDQETWGDGATATGVCTQPPNPGSTNFRLRLVASSVKSCANASLMDGNLDPPDTNAVGPSDDDYDRVFSCPD